MKNKYSKYIVLSLICTIILVGFVVYRSKNSNKVATNATQFATAEVIKGDIKVSVSGSGAVTAKDKRDVKSQISGKVNKIFFKEGQIVNEGDLLFTLDSETDNIDIERMRLTLELEEKGLISLQNELQKLKIYAPVSGVIDDFLVNIGYEMTKGFLLTSINDDKTMAAVGVISETSGTLTKIYTSSNEVVKKGQLIAELKNETLESQIENQKVKVEQARLDLEKKLKQQKDSNIYAPISGTIVSLNVFENEMISTNTILTTINEMSSLEVVVPIDELDIVKIKEGQEATVVSEAMPNTKFSAEVVKIAQVGISQGGVSTFEVTLKLKDFGQLKIGMTVNAEIITNANSDVLLLPIVAVQQRGEQKFVLMKNDIGSDQANPNIKEIKIGLVTEDYVEVVEGLNEGDVVVYPTSERNLQQQENQKSPFAPRTGMMGGRSNVRN